MSQRFVFRVLMLPCLVALFALVLLPLSAQAKKGKKYALLIGVKDYEHPRLARLRFTENDVEVLAETLKGKAIGFDSVRLLTTSRGAKNDKDAPTAENIRKEIDDLLDRAKGNDTVLVAFSGHGVQLSVADPDGKGKPRSYPYFCPSDSDFRNISYSTGKAKRLIQLETLFADLGGSRAREKLVLVDACRNEIDADSTTRNADSEQVKIPRGVGVLFSCKADEKSWENAKLGKGHGVFFHFVLKGLSGEAKNEDNDLTWDDLSRYVKRQVIRQTPKIIGGGARQTPHGLNNIVGETILARFDAGGESVVKPKPGPGKEPIGKAPAKSIKNSIGMELVYIKPGKFKMGSPKDEQDDAIADYEKAWSKKISQEFLAIYRAEGPVHEVEITKGFYMGIYEVAQHEYEKVMGTNPSWFSAEGKGKDAVKEWKTGWFPVENVSYEDAEKFCKKLSAKAGENGRVYRLPTEAEWEYACRAGTKTPFHYGESLSSDDANFNGEYPFGGAAKSTNLKRTCEVGSFKANAFGLYDMHGNVFEWCSDWYDKDTYDKGDIADPKGPNSGKYRVLRGGCWFDFGWYCRSAFRGRDSPGIRGGDCGFRVVCGSP